MFSCRDVSVFYGDNQALKNVSIDFARKQVLAMIGPSGCGKSTFLRRLNRMNDSIPGARVAGRIRLDGEDIHGTTSTGYNPDPRWHGVSEAESLSEVDLRQRGVWAEDARAGTRQRDLEEIVEHEPAARSAVGRSEGSAEAARHGLSGGQQQRLCIARAIACSRRSC